MKGGCLMRKVLFLIVLFMMILPGTSSASNLGTLNHWYSYTSITSEHGSIARWNSTIYTKHYVDDGFTNSNFLSYVNSARTTWRNAGISISSTTNDSTANLKIYGGTRSELQDRYWLLGETELGITDFDDASYEGNWKYNNKDKYGLIQNSAEAYVVYEPGRTTAQFTNVTTHE